MKLRTTFLALAVTTAAYAAAPLFNSATESKWTVTKGNAPAGTITLLTSASGTRAEFRANPKSPVVTLLGGNGKVWLRADGGDVDFATISAMNDAYTAAPALLLPFTAGDATAKDGKTATYKYRGVTASYRYDAQGAVGVDIKSPEGTYTLTRTSVAKSTADASNFTIKPKKSASSRLARLSGDLLGTSQSNVSATAGGRGAGQKGLKLADGGNYAAVEQLENRDAKWRAKLDDALAEFHKEGNVGKGREQ